MKNGQSGSRGVSKIVYFWSDTWSKSVQSASFPNKKVIDFEDNGGDLIQGGRKGRHRDKKAGLKSLGHKEWQKEEKEIPWFQIWRVR